METAEQTCGERWLVTVRRPVPPWRAQPISQGQGPGPDRATDPVTAAGKDCGTAPGRTEWTQGLPRVWTSPTQNLKSCTMLLCTFVTFVTVQVTVLLCTWTESSEKTEGRPSQPHVKPEHPASGPQGAAAVFCLFLPPTPIKGAPRPGLVYNCA